MVRVGGCVRLAEPVPAEPVNQGDAQRDLACHCGVQQVRRGQRAAGPAADDRDDRPAARCRPRVSRAAAGPGEERHGQPTGAGTPWPRDAAYRLSGRGRP